MLRGERRYVFHECGAWRSLVAHLLWEQGVGGSNPLAPTTHAVLARGAQSSGCDWSVSRLWSLGPRKWHDSKRVRAYYPIPKIVQVNDSRL